jgi:AraC-like DNA-binding protein
MCRTKTFQRECFQTARGSKESVSTNLGEYGSVVLTSAKPGLSAAQAKLEVRERIRQISETIEKRTGVPVLSGIGSFSPGGINLERSYREAVTGLHLALEKGKNYVFIEATEGERATPPHEEVRSTMRSLADAYEQGATAKVAVTREMFIRQVMFASLGQVGAVRTYLTAALQMLLDRFERKSGVGTKEARAMGDEWAGNIMEAQTPPDLVGVFGTALEALVRYQTRPHEAGAANRIESVLWELSTAPGKAWNVHMLCRKTGMSPPTFLKWFRKSAGMAFGPYLRRLRLKKAQEMLMEGNLTVERVAQECGFSSASSFIAFFQKATGRSPSQYRTQVSKPI